MNEFLVHLKALPAKIMGMINAFIAGITAQVSTGKGAIIFILIIIIAVDLFFGAAGLKHALKEGTGFLKELVEIVKDISVPVLVLIGVIFAFKK